MYTVHIQNVHRTFEEIVLRTEPKTFRGRWPWKYGLKGGGDDDHDDIGNVDTAVAAAAAADDDDDDCDGDV